MVQTRFVRLKTPHSLRKPCEPPILLPDRALTAGEVARFWGKDRAALTACEAKRQALVSN